MVRSSGTGAPSLLRADLVERLRAQDEARLPKGDAADVLGVGRTVVLDLLDRGLLHECRWKSGSIIDAPSRGRISTI